MFSFFTSTDDDKGISVTSGATAPAPPRRLMLKTYQKLTKERRKIIIQRDKLYPMKINFFTFYLFQMSM